MPSFAKRSRAVNNDSASEIVYAFATRPTSQFRGTKSSPMPSTSHDPASPCVPVFTTSASTEPFGSARTICTCGALRCMNRPIPVNVPPVQTPQTIASIRCSICSQISGAVHVSCVFGFVGLES